MLNHFNTQKSILYCLKRKRSELSDEEMSNKSSRMAKEPPDLPPDDGTTEKAEDTSRDVGLPSDVVDSVGGLVDDATPARRDAPARSRAGSHAGRRAPAPVAAPVPRRCAGNGSATMWPP